MGAECIIIVITPINCLHVNETQMERFFLSDSRQSCFL